MDDSIFFNSAACLIKDVNDSVNDLVVNKLANRQRPHQLH